MDDITVLITTNLGEELITHIGEILPKVNVVYKPVQQPSDLAPEIGEAQVLYTGSTLPQPEDATRLEWVQIHWAGVDHILEHPLYTNTDVAFTNTSGVHAINMGEYVLGLMLAFSHHIPEMVEDTRTGIWPEWRFRRYLPLELRGSTVGILGYGAIGREVARLSKSFGMTVLAMKRNLRQLAAPDTFTVEGTGDPSGEIPDRYYPPSALHSMLGECDFVVVLTPLTEATRHLIDSDALRAMKESAYLINVARGDVVDEKALLEALREKSIAGAGLDVFSEEPLPKSSPLWELDNVILSPHIAGNTPQYNKRAVELFVQNLKRFLSGDSLLNEVERSRNY